MAGVCARAHSPVLCSVTSAADPSPRYTTVYGNLILHTFLLWR